MQYWGEGLLISFQQKLMGEGISWKREGRNGTDFIYEAKKLSDNKTLSNKKKKENKKNHFLTSEWKFFNQVEKGE